MATCHMCWRTKETKRWGITHMQTCAACGYDMLRSLNFLAAGSTMHGYAVSIRDGNWSVTNIDLTDTPDGRPIIVGRPDQNDMQKVAIKSTIEESEQDRGGVEVVVEPESPERPLGELRQEVGKKSKGKVRKTPPA